MEDSPKRRAEDLTEPQSTEELTRLTYRTVVRIEKTLYGNGQPGVCERLTKVEDQARSTQSELTDYKADKINWWNIGLGLGMLVLAAIELLKR